MNKSSILRSASLALGLLFLGACQQNDLPQSEVTTTTQPTANQVISLAVEGAATPLVYNQTSKSQARTVGLKFDEQHAKYLPGLTLKNSTFKTIVYLRKKGSTDPADFYHVILSDTDWKTRKMKEGKIFIATYDENVSTSTGPTLAIPAGKHAPQPGETWEVAAILGESDAPFAVSGIQGSGDGVYWMQGPRITVGASKDYVSKTLPEVKMNIPYYSPWKEYTVDSFGRLQTKFSFVCAGSLIHYRLERILTEMEKAGRGWPPVPYPGGDMRPDLVFSTNLGTLFGACEFRQGDNDFHWVGLDRESLTKDPNFTPFPVGPRLNPATNQYEPAYATPDAYGYSIPSFTLMGEAPAHILIFVVPSATAPASPLTTLKRHPDSAPSPSLARHGQAPGRNYGEKVESRLSAAVRGKVHFGLLDVKTQQGAPQ